MGAKRHDRREEKSRVTSEEDFSQTAARNDTFCRSSKFVISTTAGRRNPGLPVKKISRKLPLEMTRSSEAQNLSFRRPQRGEILGCQRRRFLANRRSK